MKNLPREFFRARKISPHTAPNLSNFKNFDNFFCEQFAFIKKLLS